MKIGVFAYNFEHWKVQNGIHNLVLGGYTPSVIFAANRVELKFYKSKVRITPKDLFLHHPKFIADHYNIDYHVVEHNSEKTSAMIKDYNLDLGVILGARILKPHVIDSFNLGVLNTHPGILPDNRGLDNQKWAILEDIPQGVTAHLIDGKIDKGRLVDQERINIYKDDTLLDIFIRVQNLEQKLMMSSLDKLKNIDSVNDLEVLGSGTYRKPPTEDVEKYLFEKFETYKGKYAHDED